MRRNSVIFLSRKHRINNAVRRRLLIKNQKICVGGKDSAAAAENHPVSPKESPPTDVSDPTDTVLIALVLMMGSRRKIAAAQHPLYVEGSAFMVKSEWTLLLTRPRQVNRSWRT